MGWRSIIYVESAPCVVISSPKRVPKHLHHDRDSERGGREANARGCEKEMVKASVVVFWKEEYHV